jgi:hypothetical protein
MSSRRCPQNLPQLKRNSSFARSPKSNRAMLLLLLLTASTTRQELSQCSNQKTCSQQRKRPPARRMPPQPSSSQRRQRVRQSGRHRQRGSSRGWQALLRVYHTIRSSLPYPLLNFSPPLQSRTPRLHCPLLLPPLNIPPQRPRQQTATASLLSGAALLCSTRRCIQPMLSLSYHVSLQRLSASSEWCRRR